jgi:hypothetical protein
MAIFMAGVPFFYLMIRDVELRGRKYFWFAYLSLTLSNISTVLEEFYWNDFFNLLEHGSIAVGAVFLLIGVIQFSRQNENRGPL